jgi:hypothetical protein
VTPDPYKRCHAETKAKVTDRRATSETYYQSHPSL